jgi:aminoglycoside phosphotransferase (APT) family kinase protein
MNPHRQADTGRLHAALGALLGPLLRVDAIESGTSGTSYRVATADGVFAAKRFYEHADVLLGPAAQFSLLESLAPADIAPAPVACDADLGLLVTEWISDGRPAVAAELATPVVMQSLVALLKALHASGCTVPEFAPAAYLERYVDVLGGYRRLAARDRARHDEVCELAVWLEGYPQAKRLCHNDLAADNCFIGTRCRLIDFDFAVMAPPISRRWPR